MEEPKDNTWKPPEGKVFDDNLGLVSREEKIEKTTRYVTRFYWIPLGVPVLLYFAYMIIRMFNRGSDKAGGEMLDPLSFMLILFLIIFTHSRIDALVSLLKAQGLMGESANAKKAVEGDKTPDPASDGEKG